MPPAGQQIEVGNKGVRQELQDQREPPPCPDGLVPVASPLVQLVPLSDMEELNKFLADGGTLSDQDVAKAAVDCMIKEGAFKATDEGVTAEWKSYLNVPGKDGRAVLSRAAERGHFQILAALLRYGVDPAGPAPVNVLDPYTPLMFAAKNGRLECVKALVVALKDVELINCLRGLCGTPRTALMLAAEYGHPECLLVLADALNNDPKLLNKANHYFSSQTSSAHSRTALMFAAINCHPECVKILTDRLGTPALINASDSLGYTAIALAATQNKPECLMVLADALKNDANQINVGTVNLRETPMMLSAMLGKPECLKVLVGAVNNDPVQVHKTIRQTVFGQFPLRVVSALFLARENGHHECVEVLSSIPATAEQVDP